MKIADIEVSLVDHCGTDISVVNAARVSFDKESELQTTHYRNSDGSLISTEETLLEGDAKLISYLAKHKHFSPFNHSFITVRVKAPIFVARQLVKHKFMPWNEVSRRYVDDEPEFYWPDKWRAKAENVKQGSSEEASQYMSEEQWDGTEDSDCYATAETLVMRNCASLVNWYTDMVSNGVAPEQARMVLPQNTMTEWIWSGTLGAFCDMLRLRLDPHTQYESRIVAQKIYEIVKQLFPVSVDALLKGANE